MQSIQNVISPFRTWPCQRAPKYFKACIQYSCKIRRIDTNFQWYTTLVFLMSCKFSHITPSLLFFISVYYNLLSNLLTTYFNTYPKVTSYTARTWCVSLFLSTIQFQMLDDPVNYTHLKGTLKDHIMTPV